MGWEKGKYYTRSLKRNGRVVREYIGTGLAAELASMLDAREREKRELTAESWKQKKTLIEAIDNQMSELSRAVDAVVTTTLLCAGYHRHNQGEWRKKRRGSGVEKC